jgi:AraC-like DNA-binding protein
MKFKADHQMEGKFNIQNPFLKNLIQFVAFNGFEPDGDQFIPVIPDCNSALVINIGKPYQRVISDTGDTKTISGSHFVGMKSKHCFVRPNSEMKTISIRFRPGALPFFLKSNIHELTDTITDAVLVFGSDIFLLEEQFSEADNPHSIIPKIESFLLKRLYFKYHSNDILNKIKLIYKNPTSCKIESLRMENLSYKKLEREFFRGVGLMPKQFIDIVKFNYSTSLLHLNPQMTFTEIGYRAGYCDQSHFIKAFKIKSGHTPRKVAEQKSSMFLDNLQIISDEFRLYA